MTAAQLQAAWTQRAVVIVRDLYTEAFGVGGPPCPYAFCITGSGARREACPYSDLDCFMVLDHGAGGADKAAMIQHSRTVKERLDHMNFERDLAALGQPNKKGFYFCVGGLNPGGWALVGGTPQLTGTPAALAQILETNLAANNAAMQHVVSGLQESSFGFGTAALHRDFVTEIDQVMGHTCWRFSSRPKLTHLKRGGLEAIQQAVTDPDFAIPNATDTRFNVKKGFYRLPQFVVKGLAWYYGTGGVATEDQIVNLMADGRMHMNKARLFRQLLDAPLQIRVESHLTSQKEADYVRTPAHNNADGNPDNEMILTGGQVADLQLAIQRLTLVRGWAQTFVAQKNKVIGKRVNPFTSA